MYSNQIFRYQECMMSLIRWGRRICKTCSCKFRWSRRGALRWTSQRVWSTSTRSAFWTFWICCAPFTPRTPNLNLTAPQSQTAQTRCSWTWTWRRLSFRSSPRSSSSSNKTYNSSGSLNPKTLHFNKIKLNYKTRLTSRQASSTRSKPSSSSWAAR